MREIFTIGEYTIETGLVSDLPEGALDSLGRGFVDGVCCHKRSDLMKGSIASGMGSSEALDKGNAVHDILSGGDILDYPEEKREGYLECAKYGFQYIEKLLVSGVQTEADIEDNRRWVKVICPDGYIFAYSYLNDFGALNESSKTKTNADFKTGKVYEDEHNTQALLGSVYDFCKYTSDGYKLAVEYVYLDLKEVIERPHFTGDFGFIRDLVEKLEANLNPEPLPEELEVVILEKEILEKAVKEKKEFIDNELKKLNGRKFSGDRVTCTRIDAKRVWVKPKEGYWQDRSGSYRITVNKDVF